MEKRKHIVIVFFTLVSLLGCSQKSIEPSKSRWSIGNNRSQSVQPKQMISPESLYNTTPKSEVNMQVKNNIQLENENISGVHEYELKEKIKSLATKIEQEPVDAQYDEAKWTIIKEKPGVRVDLEATKAKVLSAEEGTQINLVTEQVRPKISEQDLKVNVSDVGAYTTEILSRNSSRMNNILIASRKIDYTILKPGQIFSFNNSLGMRTLEKGYKTAPIIIDTRQGPKYSAGVGGGICQISSTLYNAVDIAGLEVVERHLHSKDVGYVPKGRDATVCYGSMDFRFENNNEYPVMIRIEVEKNLITARIIQNRN